ncbi:MAG: hypothetical protein KGI50_03885 [Patescibacteria group bacterium]|nr:hypothetical protein [Patescibacteria group bacterium]MDE2438428.1 hypothetical protein [Patescibacteria group bacterium]
MTERFPSFSSHTLPEPLSLREKEYVSKLITEEIARVADATSELMALQQQRLEALIKKDTHATKHAKLPREIKALIAQWKILLHKFKYVAPAVIPLLFLAKVERTKLEHPVNNSFNNRPTATLQLQRTGITDERRAAYSHGLSELLYRGITPIGYKTLWGILQQLPGNLIPGRASTASLPMAYRTEATPGREDAWRFYLGLPQQHNTFSISNYQPEHSHEDKYYYCIRNWLEKFSPNLPNFGKKGFSPIQEILKGFSHSSRQKKLQSRINALTAEYETIAQKINMRQDELNQNAYATDTLLSSLNRAQQKILSQLQALQRIIDSEDWPEAQEETYLITYDGRKSSADDLRVGVMGEFKISRGKDNHGHYISYYDRWDLGGERIGGIKIEGENGFLGTPYEIYDRIYYNPKTYEVIAQK